MNYRFERRKKRKGNFFFLFLKKMEERFQQENMTKNELFNKVENYFSIVKYFASIWIPFRRRFCQLIEKNKFFNKQFKEFEQIKQILNSSKGKKTFRIAVISIIALRRFQQLSSKIQFVHSSSFIYDEQIFTSFNRKFLENINDRTSFFSFLFQFDRCHSMIFNG